VYGNRTRDKPRLTTDVRLEFRHATARPAFFVAVSGASGPTMPFEYRLALTATNYGEATEYVTWAAL
jgi:hypothetical protein